ncbi:MAG: iron ABC transporter permease [Victivallales bacterium]|nr:iron ABC transporter permease [Victivallales bacterium]
MNSVNKKIALAVLLSVTLLLCAPFVGSKLLLPSDLFVDTLDGMILRRMRIPRVLLGFFAGAALSFGGACFQSLFRNGLASPYTLGLSGGAALGVSIAAWLGVGGTLLGMGANGIAAFAGAFIVSALVYMLSRCGRRNDGNTMLLAGVAISFFTSSVIMFVQYAGREGELFRVMRWMSGSLAVSDYAPLFILVPMCAIALFASFAGGAEALDLLSVGDDFAASRGIDLKKARLLTFAGVSLITGAVVALCGPIGFVGLVCPHIARLAIGAPNKRLIPVAMLLGGTFLTLCDTIGRSISQNAEIPAGIISSLIGAPFFLYQLLKRD